MRNFYIIIGKNHLNQKYFLRFSKECYINRGMSEEDLEDIKQRSKTILESEINEYCTQRPDRKNSYSILRKQHEDLYKSEYMKNHAKRLEKSLNEQEIERKNLEKKLNNMRELAKVLTKK